jgi:hypothetical protein
MSRFLNRLRTARAACWLALALSAGAGGQTTLTEAQAKAAFVLNFARYVEWPSSAFASREAPVVACLFGRDGLGTALAALEGRAVQNRTLKVRRSASVEELKGCHVVFIAESEERRIVPIVRGLMGHPVLTVSDSERFIDSGGAIGLVYGDERLQFEVNRQALEQAQLKASASLLKLARTIL